MKIIPFSICVGMAVFSMAVSANPFVKSDAESSHWQISQEHKLNEMSQEIEALRMLLDEKISEIKESSITSYTVKDGSMGPGIPEGSSGIENVVDTEVGGSKDSARIIINGVQISIGEDNKYKLGGVN